MFRIKCDSKYLIRNKISLYSTTTNSQFICFLNKSEYTLSYSKYVPNIRTESKVRLKIEGFTAKLRVS